jgi:hypothetical protein
MIEQVVVGAQEVDAAPANQRADTSPCRAGTIVWLRSIGMPEVCRGAVG